MPTSHGRRTDERNSVVKRVLLRSSAFVRVTKRLVKKRPDVAEDLRAVLELLSEDAFHPTLKTHKLKGDLPGAANRPQRQRARRRLTGAPARAGVTRCRLGQETVRNCTEAFSALVRVSAWGLHTLRLRSRKRRLRL